MRRLSKAVTVLCLTLGLSFTHAAVTTSEPLASATESITVPDVLTGEPTPLEVERQPDASAEAAAYARLDCSYRWTDGGRIEVSGIGVQSLPCGATRGSGGNSVISVADLRGPICVYYGTTLAGCASAGVFAYVGNRSGYSAIVRTQTQKS